MNRLPIFNIVLGDAEGIQVMSLVDYPAVESNFLAFDKQQEMKFSVNDEEHIVFGCALRADFPIYRFDRMGEYYVVFTKDVIKQLYEKFLTENLMNNVNLNHDKETKQLMSYIADHHDNLISTLNDQQKEILEKFDDCYNELTDINEREIFSYAFKLGARIMLASLEDFIR